MSLDYKAIGMRIREKRLKKNLSQSELADKVGVSNPHISNVERGMTKVSLPTLIDMANELDTSLDDLVCDSVRATKGIYVEEIACEIEDCDTEEVRIVTDVVKTLIEGLKMRRK